MYLRMDQKTYAAHWEQESAHIEDQGIYTRLSSITPDANVLEVGLGVSFGTVALATTRSVLALDSNVDLVRKARARIRSSGANAEVLVSDFLSPSAEITARIHAFEPKVVVAWFIGSNADDQEKHASEVPWEGRAKKYRENVEDATLTLPLCQSSVEWVHLVGRGGVIRRSQRKRPS